jgi:hypothetical protein
LRLMKGGAFRVISNVSALDFAGDFDGSDVGSEAERAPVLRCKQP